jgi:hypothetical protein
VDILTVLGVPMRFDQGGLLVVHRAGTVLPPVRLPLAHDQILAYDGGAHR